MFKWRPLPYFADTWELGRRRYSYLCIGIGTRFLLATRREPAANAGWLGRQIGLRCGGHGHSFWTSMLALACLRNHKSILLWVLLLSLGNVLWGFVTTVHWNLLDWRRSWHLSGLPLHWTSEAGHSRHAIFLWCHITFTQAYLLFSRLNFCLCCHTPTVQSCSTSHD